MVSRFNTTSPPHDSALRWQLAKLDTRFQLSLLVSLLVVSISGLLWQLASIKRKFTSLYSSSLVATLRASTLGPQRPPYKLQLCKHQLNQPQLTFWHLLTLCYLLTFTLSTNPINVPALHTKQHNSLSSLIERMPSAPIHIPTQQVPFAIVPFWYGESSHGWRFSIRTTKCASALQGKSRSRSRGPAFSDSVVTAPSVNIFKKRLEKVWTEDFSPSPPVTEHSPPQFPTLPPHPPPAHHSLTVIISICNPNPCFIYVVSSDPLWPACYHYKS